MKLTKLFVACIFASTSTLAFAADVDSKLTKNITSSIPIVQLEPIVVIASENITTENRPLKKNSVENSKNKINDGFNPTPEFKSAFKECRTSVLGEIKTTHKEDRVKISKEQIQQIGQCMNDKGFVADNKHADFSEKKRKIYDECRDKAGFSKNKEDNKKLSKEALADIQNKFRACIKDSNIKSHKIIKKDLHYNNK